MPMLSVLRREDLINIGLVSVRYFGGTLLGVGGLMKAYAKSALLCVENAQKEDALKRFCGVGNFKCSLFLQRIRRSSA